MIRRERESARERRHRRVRKGVRGAADRPRLCVTRSLQHIYAQVIDDADGRTLASASTLKLGRAGGNADAARAVGKAIGEKALAAGIRCVVFDRGGYLYHGRVKALADGAREAGLDF
jgi:large subunit ribosomal protein L18